MTMCDAKFILNADVDAGINVRRDAQNITETHWGYRLSHGGGQDTAATLWGGVMRFLGMCLVMAAIGMWALPGAISQSDLIGFKLLVCVLLAGMGVIFLTRGQDAGCHEVQIDRTCREIRQVLRMKTGAETLLARHRFDEVRSVVMQVAEDDRATVYLRMTGNTGAVEVSTGGHGAIRKLASRISADLGNLATGERFQQTPTDVPVKAAMQGASVRT